MNKAQSLKDQQQYSRASKTFDAALLAMPVQECGEDFAYLPELAKKNSVRIYFTDESSAYLRKSIAEALIQAAAYFRQQGLVLRVESAYRTVDEQKRRFTERYLETKEKYPSKSKKELLDLANTYTAGIPIMAAHTAGAAVDVSLLDSKGKSLDFGVLYRHGGIESITDYPGLSEIAKRSREILKTGMQKHGFVNYPFEYWHYSVGDVCAAHILGDEYAKYGPVDYDIKTLSFKLPKNRDDLYSYFEVA